MYINRIELYNIKNLLIIRKSIITNRLCNRKSCL